MIIPVHMLAFSEERGKVRNVEIPDEEGKYVRIGELLELVFKYGQNDFQPQRMPSVSVGDVAEIDGEYYMVMGAGWKQLTKQEFDLLQPPTSSYAYGFELKKSLKEKDE